MSFTLVGLDVTHSRWDFKKQKNAGIGLIYKCDICAEIIHCDDTIKDQVEKTKNHQCPENSNKNINLRRFRK